MISFKEFLTETAKTVSKDQLARTVKNYFLKNYFTKALYDRWGKDEFMVDTYQEWVDLRLPTDVKITNGEHRVEVLFRNSLLDEYDENGNYKKDRDDPDVSWERKIDKFDAHMQKIGWFISSHGRGPGVFHKFILEPIEGVLVDDVPPKVYHFSSVVNKSKILKKGIIPHEGTRSSYRYPHRVFVLNKFDQKDVNQLAQAVSAYGSSAEDYYYGQIDFDPIAVFEIDVSKLNRGTKFFKDIDHGTGMWTKTHIPPHALKLVYEDTDQEEK